MGGEIFRIRPDRLWSSPTSYTTVNESLPGVKRPWRDVDHPPLSRAEFKDRVELYLFSPFGPRWLALGRTLPYLFTKPLAEDGGRAIKGVGLGPLACWDCGFESRRGHRCLSVVSVVCCQVEVSATGRSLFQRSPTECVSLSVIRCNTNPQHLLSVSRRGQNKNRMKNNQLTN